MSASESNERSAGLLGKPQYPEYDAIYGAGAGSVQGVLAGLAAQNVKAWGPMGIDEREAFCVAAKISRWVS